MLGVFLANRLAHGMKHPNIRMRRFYRAMERFISEYWPEYEAFSKWPETHLRQTLTLGACFVGDKKGYCWVTRTAITTHHSAAEREELIEAGGNRVCECNSHKTPTLTLLKRKTG